MPWHRPSVPIPDNEAWADIARERKNPNATVMVTEQAELMVTILKVGPCYHAGSDRSNTVATCDGWMCVGDGWVMSLDRILH